jgi:serine/threonine protein kinase
LADPTQTTSDFELRAMVSRALAANYELEDEIGRGGMGIVYRARDRRLKRTVAVKLLPPELAYRSDIRSRFLREAETSAQLNHPNIVPIFSVGEDARVVYFIMAFVEGDNLAKILQRQGRIDFEETRRILRDVADALAYAHQRGVVHRDIKPDNILIDSETGRVLVTDFGIARAISETAGSRLTATGMALGTPAYMSPEQAAGDREIDGRSDLYALGIVGYQMLSGELPFQAPNTPAMLVKHLSETPAPIAQRCYDVPDDLARAVMLCLEKRPDDRFPSAAAMVTALQTGQMPRSTADWQVPRSTADWQAPRSTADWQAPGSTPQENRLPTAYQPPPHPAPATGTSAPTEYVPTAEEVTRWEAAPVRKFRRSLAPYIAVNAVLLPVSIFTGFDVGAPVFAIWSVVKAVQYSKLWAAGYDWRDVFRQPRDRILADVVAERLDEAHAIFNEKKREELRRRTRFDRRTGGARPTPLPGGASPRTAAARIAPGTPVSPEVHRARSDRDQIYHLLHQLSDEDREMLRDVGPSADALVDRVIALSQTVASLERQDVTGQLSSVDREISELEAQANPLDHDASERRVRRLAQLRRRRRGLVELRNRRDDSRSKLESCRIALENVRLDVLRLHSGTQSYQQVTLVAERAMQLARDVDNFVQAVDESSRVAAGAR